jgi:molecular chaperone DnaK
MSSSDQKQIHPIVGIDLGTTNSLVAIADQDGARVLGDPDSQLMPSVVRIERDGSVVVGREAADQIVEFPDRTINSVKRLMGRSARDIQTDLGFLGYRVVEGEHETARVSIEVDADKFNDGHLQGGQLVVSPQEISAHLLSTLKANAESALGHPVDRAVVTVPAYFDDAQRQATRDAGRLAGLDVVRMVNEPTAAALAYGIGTRDLKQPQVIAVYDLGGGTFDISILRLIPGDQKNSTDFFQVLSTAGDTHLGGDDVDHRIVELFVREISDQLGLSESQPISSFDNATRRALVGFAREVKHRLSTDDSASVEIDLGNNKYYKRSFTIREFDELITEWIGRSIDACSQALRDAKKASGDRELHIDSVVLVGGSTRIPAVRRRVGEFFGVEPYTAIDPDRVVAMGAAIQAAIIDGTQSGSLLVDVIPLSLGIETAGGAVAKLIMRNSTVPTRVVERFSTSVDGQVNVKVNIVQGEREMVEDCRSLGIFELRGIPPMPAGVPKLVVEFLIDANGVLNVSAIEERSGKRAEIQIVPNHGLSRQEVDRMEHESFVHAREDMRRHQVVDLIANASLDLKWITERFTKFDALLEDDYRASLAEKIASLRGFIERAKMDWTSVEPNQFHHVKEELDRASMRLQEIGIAESLREDHTE